MIICTKIFSIINNNNNDIKNDNNKTIINTTTTRKNVFKFYSIRNNFKKFIIIKQLKLNYSLLKARSSLFQQQQQKQKLKNLTTTTKMTTEKIFVKYFIPPNEIFSIIISPPSSSSSLLLSLNFIFSFNKQQQQKLSSKSIVKPFNYYYLFILVLFFSFITTTINANKINDADFLLTTLLTAKSHSSSNVINDRQIDLIEELKRSYLKNITLLDHKINVLHLSTINDNEEINNNRQIIKFDNNNDNNNISKKAIEILTNNNDITILIKLKQYHHNTGVLFSFTNGSNRIFEIQSSGRRKELRLHYRLNNLLYTETFDNVDIVDDKWHKLALIISYKQLDLYIDCIHRYRRIIKPIDRSTLLFNGNNNQNNNITLWIGQRGPNHFIYKGSIGELKILSTVNGLNTQCPYYNLETACPTCGQYKELKDSINQLENIVKYLSEKLLIMEQRLSNREQQQCECNQIDNNNNNIKNNKNDNVKSCYMNGTKYNDGDEWYSNDYCHHCKCLTGSISCYQMTGCKNHKTPQSSSSSSSSLIQKKSKSDNFDLKSKSSSASSSLTSSLSLISSSLIGKSAINSSTSSSSLKCLYNKKIYYEGDTIERWINKNQPNRSKCFECKCHSRSMRCKEKYCPELNCPQSKRIQPDDKCCMICETDFCSLGHNCHKMADCFNLATNYTCHCKNGYKGNGHTCYDIDECNYFNIKNQNPLKQLTDNHNNNDNNNNIYRHKCNIETSICINKPGSYECQCKSGFTQITQYDCIDIDECTNGKNNCSVNAICLNQPGSYQCQCKPGYEGDGYNCKPVCNDSCLNGGHCRAPNTCSCRKGYYGHRCEEDIDECKLGIHKCPKNSKCINKFGWYRCECLDGYENRIENDDFNDLNFECIDIDECLDPLLNTCPSNSKCINVNGTYRCQCDLNNYNDNNNDTIICPKTCIVNGIERKHMEKWNIKNSCNICQCIKGTVICKPKLCNCFDKNDYSDLNCCTECHTLKNINKLNNEKFCYHQDDNNIKYRNGERWTYECETCECMNGEIDCWNECPKINCLNAIRIDGDCCLRCEENDPCQSESLITTGTSKSSSLIFNDNLNSTNLAGCHHQNNYYQSGQRINIFDDKCTTCLCQNGRFCCSYKFSCLNNDNNGTTSINPKFKDNNKQQQQRQNFYQHENIIMKNHLKYFNQLNNYPGEHEFKKIYMTNKFEQEQQKNYNDKKNIGKNFNNYNENYINSIDD